MRVCRLALALVLGACFNLHRGEPADGSPAGADGGGDAAVGTDAGPICGNGVLEAAEACDDGNTADDDLCPTTCAPARCGDGFVRATVEACDDANTADGDGCFSNCTVCPGFFWPANGHCYVELDVPAGRTAGYFDCQAALSPSYFATLSTAAEWDAVRTGLIQEEAWWIGFEYNEPQGPGYHWVTREAISFTNWVSGQPDFRDGNGPCGTSCGAFMDLGGQWGDAYWHTPFALVCERHPWTVRPETAHAYRFFEETRTCPAGSHLAFINDAGEQAYVASLLPLDSDGAVLLGAGDAAVEGTFVWDDGSPLDYTNFNAGEPNDGLGMGAEDCLSMLGQSHLWNDIPCDYPPLGALCEVDR